MRADIRAVPFDLVVIDEAHKLRNAYRPNNKMGPNIKLAIEERRKILLTATPLQNTLVLDEASQMSLPEAMMAAIRSSPMLPWLSLATTGKCRPSSSTIGKTRPDARFKASSLRKLVRRFAGEESAHDSVCREFSAPCDNGRYDGQFDSDR